MPIPAQWRPSHCLQGLHRFRHSCGFSADFLCFGGVLEGFEAVFGDIYCIFGGFCFFDYFFAPNLRFVGRSAAISGDFGSILRLFGSCPSVFWLFWWFLRLFLTLSRCFLGFLGGFSPFLGCFWAFLGFCAVRRCSIKNAKKWNYRRAGYGDEGGMGRIRRSSTLAFELARLCKGLGCVFGHENGF